MEMTNQDAKRIYQTPDIIICTFEEHLLRTGNFTGSSDEDDFGFII